jgi:hypothetical protein
MPDDLTPRVAPVSPPLPPQAPCPVCGRPGNGEPCNPFCGASEDDKAALLPPPRRSVCP